jgi:hypothetical protein
MNPSYRLMLAPAQDAAVSQDDVTKIDTSHLGLTLLVVEMTHKRSRFLLPADKLECSPKQSGVKA